MHVFLGYVRTDIEKKRQYFHTAKEEIAGQNLLFLQLASISTVALLLIFFLLPFFSRSSPACTFDLRLKYQQLSQQDFLSGILNKQTFGEKGRCCMESLTPSSHCALLLLDLDDFKLVNDSLGHYAGDQLLRQIGEFLQHAFRSTDLIGRFGGDEFIVLMKGPMSTAIVEKKASLILQMLRSIQMSGLPKEITCSIGCVVSEDGDTYDELFIKADKALYTAKKNGKNGYHLYS